MKKYIVKDFPREGRPTSLSVGGSIFFEAIPGTECTITQIIEKYPSYFNVIDDNDIVTNEVTNEILLTDTPIKSKETDEEFVDIQNKSLFSKVKNIFSKKEVLLDDSADIVIKVD